MNDQKTETKMKLPVWLSWLLPVLAWPVLIGINLLFSGAAGGLLSMSQNAQIGWVITQAVVAGGVFLAIHLSALMIAYTSEKAARMQAITGFFAVIFSLGSMALLLYVAMATGGQVGGN